MAHEEAATSAEPTLPEPSWAPILLALGIGAIYFTFLLHDQWGGAPVFVAIAFLFVTLFYWIHQDALWFKRNVSTGYRNPYHGTVFFIATEIMFFGALFATYFYYKIAFLADGNDWVPTTADGDIVELPLVLTGINTIILFASGATMHWAHKAIQKGNQAALKIGLVLTIILGGVFLAIQANEYRELIHEGMTATAGLFGTTFYMLTGTHGAHVLGGLIYLVIVLWRSTRNRFTPERHAAVETAAIYWHFVDVVWVFVYGIIYLKLI